MDAQRQRKGRKGKVETAHDRLRTIPRPLRNVLKPIELYSAERIEAIHEGSMRLLERHGIEFMGAEARRTFRAAGADVDDTTGFVRIPREVVAKALATAPREFTLTPRNPERRLVVGGNVVNCSLVAGPPFVDDRVNGRRRGSTEDYVRLVKLAQSFDIIHYIGNQPTAPIELEPETRHLETYRANLLFTDKVFQTLSIGRDRSLDGIDMMAITRGLTREEMAKDPGILTIISVNSPRRFDEAMTDGLAAMAGNGQAVCITPFTLMGAMTPVTLSAALIQQNAEALAGITLIQLVKSGAPAVYGAFTSNVALRSGAPAFGTPENIKATLAAGQLARRYGLPYRASNSNAANAVDAQAGYESMNSIWGAVMGGANLVYHGAGWMEGGLQASFEKIVVDVEMLQMMAETISEQPFEDIEESIAAIAEVMPGGHFFGAQHTLARYRSAFYEPIISDWRNHEAWAEAGSPTAAEHATRVWQERLAAYEQPALDPARAEALDAFVARRKEEIARAAP